MVPSILQSPCTALPATSPPRRQSSLTATPRPPSRTAQLIAAALPPCSIFPHRRRTDLPSQDASLLPIPCRDRSRLYPARRALVSLSPTTSAAASKAAPSSAVAEPASFNVDPSRAAAALLPSHHSHRTASIQSPATSDVDDCPKIRARARRIDAAGPPPSTPAQTRFSTTPSLIQSSLASLPIPKLEPKLSLTAGKEEKENKENKEERS
jgi:hypothetical protein